VGGDAAVNYQQLTDAITSTTENFESTFMANIAEFVRLAEREVFNSVHLLTLRNNVTSEFVPNTPYLKLPPDFLAVYSLAVVDDAGMYHYLIDKDVSFIREAYPDPTNDVGLPTHYGLFDDCSLIVGPAPDKSYRVEMHHFYYPPSIVDNGTSWLGDNFDSVLLYGALVHANVYMKGSSDVTASYQKQFSDNMMLLKQLADGMNRQDTYRSGQVRIPVQ
jgi:hypothetical protein